MSINDLMSRIGPYNGGGRTEITNLELRVRGKLPDDLSGVAYFNSMNGSFNSKGLPFKKNLPDGKPNPEFGTPFINGDGMVYSVDMQNPGKVLVTSRFMKTPSYYADEATSIGGEAREEYEYFKFMNFGLARLSLCGSRNYVNTALIPVDFDNDTGPSMLATIDAGRPFKIDPKSLDILTPIGWNHEWNDALPEIMPFPLVCTSAHPSYDPVTKELFTVNYIQSLKTQLTKIAIGYFLFLDREKLRKGLLKIAEEHDEHKKDQQAIQEINLLMEECKKQGGFMEGEEARFKKLLDFEDADDDTKDQAYLLKFDNKGLLKRWRLVNQDNEDLVINQCMHQTSLSKNYILLMDSSFKFAFELLFANPFPNSPKIDKFLRGLFSKRMLPYTAMWIVDRRSLDEDADIATAKRVSGNIPFECIHFSTEYDDEGDILKFYTMHNNAACFAEWIRSYDVNYFTGKEYPDYLVGDFATGEMALGALGKFEVDGKTATIMDNPKILRDPGNVQSWKKRNAENYIGPNTWGIGLYTFRHMISPHLPNRKIKELFFINFGANPLFLTKWIYNLYKKYPKRKLSRAKFLKYTKRGIPTSIGAVSTEDMSFTGYLELAMDKFPTSIQYVPKAGSEEDGGGYLIVVMKVPDEESSTKETTAFKPEIWILDASKISEGPVCILDHPDLDICFTVHSTWLPSNKSINSGYKVNIEKDYEKSVKGTPFEPFFNDYVFLHFK